MPMIHRQAAPCTYCALELSLGAAWLGPHSPSPAACLTWSVAHHYPLCHFGVSTSNTHGLSHGCFTDHAFHQHISIKGTISSISPLLGGELKTEGDGHVRP